MFGKRNKPEQSQDDQFEAGEFGNEEFAGNEDFADDSWDPDSNGQDDGLEAAPQSRRSSPLSKLLPWAALGVIGAGAAGYFYLNNPMMTSAPATETQVVAAAPETPVAETAAAPADVTTTPVEPSPEPAPVVAEETTPVAPPATEATMAAAEPQVQAPVEAPVAEVAPPVKPEAVAAPVETPVVVATPAVTAPAVAAPVVAAPAEKAPAALPAAVSQRLDVIEHQIADLSKVVDRAASRPAATENKAQSEKIASLEATVRQLQKEIAALKAAPVAAPARESSPTPPVAEIAKPAVTETKPVAEVAKPAAQVAKPVAPAPVKANWILRAAQNGEAWISPSLEGDITHVIIGQNVRGLGKVTAIRSVNGKWEVVGTQGTIRQ